MAELTQQVGARSVAKPIRLPSLTGMRFLAAAAVFLHHTTFANMFSSAGARDTYTSIVGQGNTGVSFFFVLSGFVLAWSVRPTDTTAKFWRRRFFKIFPNHIVVWVLTLLFIGYGLTTFGVTTKINWWHAVLNLLMLQSWPHNLAIIFSLNLVTWSLSCELFFYFCFPLLMFGIAKIRPQRLWLWAAIAAAGVIAVPFIARLLPSEPAIPGVGLNTWQLWFIQVFPPVRMLEFIFGLLLARIVLANRRLPLGVGGAVALSVAAYALTPLFPASFRLAAIMVIPLGLLIAAGAQADVAKQGSWLSSRTMIWLGEISFAFYLFHYMVIMTLRSHLGAPTGWSTPVAFAVMALMFVITLVLSSLLYSAVERPIMRRFATARRRAPETVELPATAPDDAPVSPAPVGAAGANTTTANTTTSGGTAPANTPASTTQAIVEPL